MRGSIAILAILVAINIGAIPAVRAADQNHAPIIQPSGESAGFAPDAFICEIEGEERRITLVEGSPAECDSGARVYSLIDGSRIKKEAGTKPLGDGEPPASSTQGGHD